MVVTASANPPLITETVAFRGVDAIPLVGERALAGARGAAKPPILLAHGFGQTRQSWSQTQSRLAVAGHESFSWDVRGHGESGRNAADYRYEASQFLGDVIAAARQLPDAPVLVGASMGGLTGLMAQAQQPLFSALVLVDVTPRWEAAGVQRIQAFMTAHPQGFDSFEHAAEAIASYLPHRRERKTPQQLASLLRPDARTGQLHWHWDPRMLGEFVAGSEHLQEVISAAAARIDVPMLLISGGRSDLVSERTVEHFLELVPRAKHVQLPQATHMLAGDDNDAFSDTLLHFLSAQFPGKEPLR
jgi:pimeloyl-ACP methyl ester carboxylesterase